MACGEPTFRCIWYERQQSKGSTASKRYETVPSLPGRVPTAVVRRDGRGNYMPDLMVSPLFLLYYPAYPYATTIRGTS